jgi:hypothetical protein
MSATPEMPSVRRRAIPGLDVTPPSPPPPPRPDGEVQPVVSPTPRPGSRPDGDDDARRETARERRPAADYGSTRLVNFRLPIDLHDRYKALVREAEARHPRLRHPSLTELLIGLLEEAPADADGVAELIRRKRAAEHGVGG